MLGLTMRRVQQWALRQHKQKIGRDYLFSPAEIAQIRSTIGNVGRPKKINAIALFP